jgi:hypothetical protein
MYIIYQLTSLKPTKNEKGFRDWQDKNNGDFFGEKEQQFE